MPIFDEAAKQYDDWYTTPLGHFVDEVEKKMIAQLLQPQPGEKALDVGSGTGNFSFWLARQQVQVTGLDESPQMMAKAMLKEQEQSEHLIPIEWREGDAHHIPFPDHSFDMVFSVSAVEFMENPQQVVSEMIRAAKPGGRIVLGVIGKESSWGELYEKIGAENTAHFFAKGRFFTEELLRKLSPLPASVIKGLYIPPDFEHFSPQEALQQEENGQQEQLDPAGFLAIRWIKEELA